MTDNRISVRLNVKTQEAREALKDVISTLGGFILLQQSSDTQPCALLIMEIGDEPELEKEFRHIEEIQSSGKVAEIFLTSKSLKPEILLKALRSGVKEFLPQPVNKKEAMDAFLRFRQRKGHEDAIRHVVKRGKIIYLLGSKGGVGTTTIAVNLATNLINLEDVQSVALIDMNLIFGEVPVFLGLKPSFDWIEIIKNFSRLDATYLMSTLSKHSSGIHVLPSPSKLAEEYANAPHIIESLMELMRSSFDFIVIDGGQALDEVAKGLLKISDTVLIVAVSSLPCLINVTKVISTFNILGYPAKKDTRIILNRYQKNSFISLKEAEESISAKFLLNIPNDYQTAMSAINQGKPLADIDNKTKISKSMKELSFIVSGKGPKKKKRTFGFKLLG
ncbi:AAA family ATPase [bacterium]|nr:AAA family ATPase [bacterium]